MHGVREGKLGGSRHTAACVPLVAVAHPPSHEEAAIATKEGAAVRIRPCEPGGSCHTAASNPAGSCRTPGPIASRSEAVASMGSELPLKCATAPSRLLGLGGGCHTAVVSPAGSYRTPSTVFRTVSLHGCRFSLHARTVRGPEPVPLLK